MFSKYPDFAQLLLQSRLQPEEGGDISPLYLLVNLSLSPEFLRVLQSILGSLALVAVFLIGRTLFGRVAGWVALALAALAAPLLLYEATLEPDLLILVANVGALALLVVGNPREHPRVAYLAGAILGLSSALRPSNLLLVLVAVLWLGWTARALGWRRIIRTAGGMLACGVVMLMLPLGLLRASVGQQLTATMSVGEMLHICNRPEGNGIGYQSPSLVKLVEQQVRSRERPDPFHAIYRRFARAAEGPQLSPLGCERYWVNRTTAFIHHEPLAWLRLVGAKFLVFLAGPDAHDVAEVRQAEQSLPVPPLASFRFLTAAGLAGLAACALRRRPVRMLGPYLLAILAVSLVFCVTSRYALMVLPVWCALAGAFVAGVGQNLRRPRELVSSGLALLVPLAISFGPGLRASTRVVERGGLAGAAATEMEHAVRAGHLKEAEDAFTRAQAAQPLLRLSRDLSSVPFERPELARASAAQSEQRFGVASGADSYFQAKLLALGGECERGLPLADRSAQQGFFAAVWDVSLDADLLAAECLLSQGNAPAARERVTRSLQHRPGTLTGLAWATAADRSVGRRDGSAERELRALHDPLSAGYALSQALLSWGDAAGALEETDRVLAALPEAGVVRYVRARSLLALSRNGEALDEYQRALAAFPAHGYETKPFDAAIAEARTANPSSPAVLALAAEHEKRAGRLTESREAAEKAAASYGVLAPQRLRDLLRWLQSLPPMPAR
jgi:Dolichyl-phosphate-mannose-protein mannosyltransferase